MKRDSIEWMVTTVVMFFHCSCLLKPQTQPLVCKTVNVDSFRAVGSERAANERHQMSF